MKRWIVFFVFILLMPAAYAEGHSFGMMTYYIAQPGDTVNEVAGRYGAACEDITKLNILSGGGADTGPDSLHPLFPSMPA